MAVYVVWPFTAFSGGLNYPVKIQGMGVVPIMFSHQYLVYHLANISTCFLEWQKSSQSKF